MKTYKLRHKPTGLYFTGKGGRQGESLSKIGKNYNKFPTFKYVEYITIDEPFKRRETKKDDWEVVIFEIKEIGTDILK
jgi:hypothetical protein